MAATYGYFAKFFDDGIVDLEGRLALPIPLADYTRWQLEFTVQIDGDNGTLTVFHTGGVGTSNAINLLVSSSIVAMEPGNSGPVEFTTALNRYSLHHVIIDYDAAQTGLEWGVTVDGVDYGRKAAPDAGWSTSMSYLFGVGDDVSLSHFKITHGASLENTAIELNGNQVRDAAGTGFISRKDADITPANAAAEYDYTLYDISGNDNHMTMYDDATNATYSSWASIIGVTSINGQDPTSNPSIAAGEEVVIESSGLDISSVTLYPTDNVTRVLTPTYTFVNGTTTTFTLPAVADNVTNFLFAGSVTIELSDGTTTKTIVFDHTPPAPYQSVTFPVGVVTRENSALPFMADPVEGGDQCWFDPAYRTVMSDNTLTNVAAPPWTYQELLITSTESQTYSVTDGTAAAFNHGWFFTLAENAPLTNSIPSMTGAGWRVEWSAFAPESGSASVKFLEGSSSSHLQIYSDGTFRLFSSGSIIAQWFNVANDGNDYEGLLEGTATPAYNLTGRGVNKGEDGTTNTLHTINALGSAGATFSKIKIVDTANAVVVNWDGNLVLNAAGNGFVSRMDANNDPSLAETGFELKLYDVSSVTGNHVALPASTTWELIDNTLASVDSIVTAGSTANYTISDFTPNGIALNGYSVPFTGTTFDAPALGDVANFPKFNSTTTVTFTDANNNVTSTTTDWQPHGTMGYVDLTSDPSTTDPASIAYGKNNPPLTGDQIVFDTTKLTVDNAGIISVVSTEANFTSAYYVIDDTGASEGVINGGNQAVVTPVSFSGTVSTLNASVNSAFTVDLSSYFVGSETPFSYAVTTGTLPSGLTLNSATGVISGTPTATSTANIVVTVTDAASNTANTNTFSIDVAAEKIAPVADAGVNQVGITAGATVTLNGSGSSDSDGTIASYYWSQTEGDTVTLSDANVAQPTFTAPTSITGQVLTFELTVTDNDGLTHTDTVSHSIEASDSKKGSPIPVERIIMESRGWPYNPGNASGSKWGAIPKSNQALAVFDAAGGGDLTQSGRIKFNNATTKFPNVVVPNTSDQGWRVRFTGKTSVFDDNQQPEMHAQILIPTDHFYEYIELYQPVNYTLKLSFYFKCDLSTIPTWAIGDSLETPDGNYGTIIEIGLNDSGQECIAVSDYGPSHPSVAWNTDTVITNTTRGETVTSLGAVLISTNNKFSIWWVDDGDANNGYSNSAYNMEVQPTSNFTGSSKIKFQVSASNVYNNRGNESNSLAGEPSEPVIFDVADNGSWIGFILERKRSPSDNRETGEFRIWKKTYRTGGAYPEWTLIFENTTLRGYTEPEANVFEYGYLFGWANMGYQEETDFYMRRYEYWEQKPTFLVDLGV